MGRDNGLSHESAFSNLPADILFLLLLQASATISTETLYNFALTSRNVADVFRHYSKRLLRLGLIADAGPFLRLAIRLARAESSPGEDASVTEDIHHAAGKIHCLMESLAHTIVVNDPEMVDFWRESPGIRRITIYSCYVYALHGFPNNLWYFVPQVWLNPYHSPKPNLPASFVRDCGGLQSIVDNMEYCRWIERTIMNISMSPHGRKHLMIWLYSVVKRRDGLEADAFPRTYSELDTYPRVVQELGRLD